LGDRSVGTIKLSLQQSIQYAKERHQFGQPIANFGLIQHKLAEMMVRAFVGESILYRTLGMIDQALERVDKDDPTKMLKVLEQYAVECSIIKVWMSEALAYVVDEEVQVFGGYGYSKEYPAERAYRDARIARIYEGTNEINRIVIGGQLLRRASAGELALFEADKQTSRTGTSTGNTLSLNKANIEFTEELLLIKAAKAMTVGALAGAARVYGDLARDQQEIIGLIAEMVMDTFAMESALLRTQRLIAESPSGGFNVQTDITRVFARDASARIERAARIIATELADKNYSAILERVVHRSPIKVISARRRIAAAALSAGRYNL